MGVTGALHQTKLARAGGSLGEASLPLMPPDKLLQSSFLEITSARAARCSSISARG